MKLVIQRVKKASVSVDGEKVGEIGKGLLVLLGIAEDDHFEQIDWFVKKLVELRIFEDEAGKMNLSVQEVSGEVLVVSQFTLYADCQKGRRPSFIKAAGPDKAEPIYNAFVDRVEEVLGKCQTGRFGAMMDVMLINDGPVTIIL